MTGARAALSPCAEAARKGDPDRYLCALFAPPDRREALFALYAFNVELVRAREAAREPLLGLMRLQWWRDALDGILAGRPPGHAAAEELARARARLDRAALLGLIEARRRDFDETPFASLAELEGHVEATSAALARQALGLLGVEDEAARAAARHVGLAWGLVGLLRAVPFHARARRLYLPADLLAAAGVEAEAIFAARPGAGLGRVAAEVAEAARGHLAAARALRPRAPRAGLPALLPARLAAADLARLARAGFDPFAPRLAASGLGRRLGVVAGAIAGRY